MSNFDQSKFNDFLIQNDVIGFFETPITTKSGRLTNWYANWRSITEDVYLTDVLTDFILDFVQTNGIEFDCLYGVPEGATKTALVAQFKWAKGQADFAKRSHVLSMGRAKPKDHGAPQDTHFVGAPHGKVVVLEDVTTTGGSLITNLEKLQEMGVNVVCALALFNRMEKRDDGKSVQEKIEEMGIQYISMSNAVEVLPGVVEKHQPSDEVIHALQKYFET